MNKLKCYIFGMMTVILAIPIIEQITEIVCGGLEVLKGKNAKKVMQINKEIEDLQMQLEPINTNCIGFKVPNQEEYYEDDWEEENKNKIGFR
jgi:hypothetical protein